MKPIFIFAEQDLEATGYLRCSNCLFDVDIGTVVNKKVFNTKAPVCVHSSVKPYCHSQLSGSETEVGPTNSCDTSKDTLTSDTGNECMHKLNELRCNGLERNFMDYK